MKAYQFVVDEIEIAGGKLAGSAKGRFEADEFDYEVSNVEILSYELFGETEAVELSEAEKAELVSVVYAALEGAERASETVVVSAIGVEV